MNEDNSSEGDSSNNNFSDTFWEAIAIMEVMTGNSNEQEN